MYYIYNIISIILILAALGSALSGAFNEYSAPQQSVIIGEACFFGILARIAQASAHHIDSKAKKE